MENYSAVEAGARAYLKAMIFLAGDKFGNFVEQYGPEDAAEETLAFVAGEAYAITQFLEKLFKLKGREFRNPWYLGKRVCENIVLRAMVGMPYQFSSVDNNFCAEDFDTVYAWYVERLFQGKLVMYAGDDHKLYVDGFEWKTDKVLSVDSKCEGVGAMREIYEIDTVSRSAAELEISYELHQEDSKLISCKEIGNENLYTGART